MMSNSEELIATLREAGEVDRGPDGSGPLTFCHEAADAIEKLEVEVARLTKREDWLECLEAAGVDNWEGYDEARAIQRGDTNDEDEDF